MGQGGSAAGGTRRAAVAGGISFLAAYLALASLPEEKSDRKGRKGGR